MFSESEPKNMPTIYSPEEREAWDRYFSGLRRETSWSRNMCAEEADAMLAERRKRFGECPDITWS